MSTPCRTSLATCLLGLALPSLVGATTVDTGRSAAFETAPESPRQAFLREQNARFALGVQYESPGSGDPYMVGLHLAQLNNRKPDQIGWGFSARFGITPGMLERDTTNRPGEIAPSDATPAGTRRIRALEISGGVNVCLAAPFWLELGGGYLLPERTAGYVTKNGNPRWYAAGENSALPMAMGALVADLSSYRVPVYLRLGASRADNTTFWSAGLGWSATLPD